MKIKGRTFDKPRELIFPIPRTEEEGGDVVFVFRAVTDESDLLKINPFPKPPRSKLPGGETKFNVEDETYQLNIGKWNQQRRDWIFLKSISATEGLEFPTIDMANPDTYENWRKEFQDSFFSFQEIDRIENACWEINVVTDQMIEEARKRFLASKAVVATQA